MKYSSYIDNVTSKKWGLNIQLAYLFSWIYSLPSWADSITIHEGVFYFASKSKVIEDIPLLTDKIDTIYRYYKFLHENGLILLKKIEGRDYIKLTEKAKEWGTDELGKKSEHSEKNPSKVGKFSENDSEKNPTYKIISTDKIITDTIFTFDAFWKAYGKYVGKQDAEKAWEKISEVDREKIMKHLEIYCKKEKQYRRDPIRYLKHKVWNDEVVINRPAEDSIRRQIKNLTR